MSHNLKAWIINRDPNGQIGQSIAAPLLNNSFPVPKLNWIDVDPSLYPTMQAIEQAVAVDENTWIVVEIAANATAALEAARTNPSTPNAWNNMQAIQVYYSEARNQQIVDGLILGATRGLLNIIVPMVERTSSTQWLSANAANAAAINGVVTNAPQALFNPLGVSYVNLRPWNQPVAIAPTFVGLIYAMILAFNVTMGNFGMRQAIQRKLRLRSYMLMRITVPICAYLFLSCMFSLINIPFKLSFGGMGLGYGAGFMTWWCFTFLGMCVLGLATEAVITLVGPQFVAFFLILFIIINVAVANVPIEVQVSLVRRAAGRQPMFA